MIQIGVCDDELPLLQKMEGVVREFCTQNHIFATVRSYEKSQGLLYEIEDGVHFDLLLLDIEMPDMDGMELAGHVRLLLPEVLVIFITSHLEYALDAYELSVFRYIPKADPGGRLLSALSDAVKRIGVQQQKSYLIQNQSRIERVPLKNLLYIVHEGKNALLVTNLGEKDKTCSYRVRKSLQQVYRELDAAEFLFIDRGCIVNLSQVMSVRGSFCILRDGTKLAVSQNRMQELKARLLEFWKRHI